MPEAISHAELTDRNLSEQHAISSISGLDTALAVLASNDHASREHAYDAINASHTSIHHASVAVAEAAYIESILNRLETLSVDISGQQQQIATLVERVEAGLASIEASMANIEQIKAEAQAAASEANGYAMTASSVYDAITQLNGILTDAISTSSDIVSARDRSIEAANRAEAALLSVENKAQQANQSALTASNSATEAGAVLSAAQEVMTAAQNAATMAANAASASRTIVDSVTQYASMNQDAQASAIQAANSATEASEALELIQTNAARIEYIYENISTSAVGAMHLKGHVASSASLPSTANEGDIMYSIEDYMYFIYTGVAWRILSNVRQWASASEELPDSETVNRFREGSVITLITGDLDESSNSSQEQGSSSSEQG